MSRCCVLVGIEILRFIYIYTLSCRYVHPKSPGLSYTYTSLQDDPDNEIKTVVHSLDAWDGKALSADPPISAAGVLRAQALARYFQDSGLDRVYGELNKNHDHSPRCSCRARPRL